MWLRKSAALSWLESNCPVGVAVPRFIALPVADRDAAPDHAAQLRGQLAVRSDRLGEGDGSAGRWHSQLHVPSSDPDAVRRAVDAVVASYGSIRTDDSVLLQRQVLGANVVGVARSHAIPDLRYASISWIEADDCSLVTAARSDCWTALHAHGASIAAGAHRTLRRRIVETVEWLSTRANQIVEIEWLWRLRRLQIVQLRACGPKPAAVRPRRFGMLEKERRKRSDQVLTQMSDWNPAELLGEHPRPLALSLFREIVSAVTWREARRRLGYAAAKGDLLTTIAGRPYVRVASSLHSLLPRQLSPAIRERIVAKQLRQLAAHPEWHDRVEFECALSCFEFDIDRLPRFQALNHGDRAALRCALIDQAPSLFSTGALADALRTAHSYLAAPWVWPDSLSMWRRQLRSMRRRLAIPFAQSARRTFAYETLLQSAERVGQVSASALRHWRASASPLAQALQGHAGSAWRQRLRVSTFDITSEPRGASVSAPIAPAIVDAEGDWSGNADPLAVSASELRRGFGLAHAARDWGKLALALAISDALEALAEWGRHRGLAREDLSWLRLNDLDRPDAIRIAAKRRLRHARDAQCRLPLVLSPDVRPESFLQLPGQPAYIGRGRVSGGTLWVDEQTRQEQIQPGRILLMSRCEPGFDWVFGRRPAAVVTAYGGPNAHVALRAHELAIPALLGIGPEHLSRLQTHHAIEIDFDARRWVAHP